MRAGFARSRWRLTQAGAARAGFARSRWRLTQAGAARAGFARSRWRRTLPGGAAGNVARYLAPAAFLLAVTAAVLVVRSTLRSHDKPVEKTTPATLTTIVVGRTPRTTRPGPTPAPKRYYVIQSGDTLDGIAARLGTTVTELLHLNPGIEPTALTPGKQVRVK